MNRFLLILLLFPFLLSAQDRTIDSLKLALKNAKHDTSRCNILSILTDVVEDENEWSKYNKQLFIIASRNQKNGTIDSPKNIYLKYLATCYNNFGYLNGLHGDTKNCIINYKKSYKIDSILDNKLGIGTSLNNIAHTYNSVGDVKMAIEYYHKSLRVMESINNLDGIARCLNNIGYIQKNLKEYDNALVSYKKSLELKIKLKDNKGLGIVYNNLGAIYDDQNNFEMALSYYEKSLKIRKEIKDNRGIAESLNNIGILYFNENEFNKVLPLYNEALKIQRLIKDEPGIAHSLINLANVLLKLGDLENAKKNALESLRTSKLIGYPNKIESSASTLKEIYKKQNNFKGSLEMFELEILMRDSLINTENKKTAIKKQFQYEYEKKATADSVKNAEEQKVKNALLTAQQAQLKQEKTQRLALYGGLALVIAFSGFVFNRFRVTQKQKVIIEHQKVLVDEAFAHLEEKNKEVLDSIRYAKRIQTALLTSEKYIERKMNELNS